MIRAVVTTALVVTWVGVADAGSGRKVAVESDPAGATVYLNEKESGPKCETPCTIEVPAGENSVIIELKDHKSEFQPLVVPKRGRVPKISVKLLPAVGTIVVDGPAGATIQVDEADQGKAPAHIETSEDSHHVVVMMNGKSIYDQYVDVTTGNETTVTPKQVATAGGGGSGDAGDGGEGGEGDEGGEGGPKVTRTATPRSPHDVYVRAAAVMDIGFRNFTYSGVGTGDTLRTESEGGQVLAGPLIELWPGQMIGVHALRGLSLLGRFEFGLNSQEVKSASLTGKTTTFWQSMEVSLRNRWTIAQMFTAQIELGYVRDQYQFEGFTDDVAKVPDVDYQSLRIGGRASVLLDSFEPYISVENRVVESSGKLAARFADASASGLRGALGVDARIHSFTARVEGAIARYSWDLTPSADGMYVATGAVDSIRYIQIALGYQY